MRKLLTLSIFLLIVSTGMKAQTIALDGTHGIVICPDSTLLNWGRSILGDGDPITRKLNPVQVLTDSGGTPFGQAVAVDVAGTSNYVIRADSTLWAWGNNANGRLGVGDENDRLFPTAVLGPGGVGQLDQVIDVSAMGRSTFALRADSTVWAWGRNADLNLGIDQIGGVQLFPNQVVKKNGGQPIDSIVAIATGYQHGLALHEDGTIWAWGDSDDGQVGVGIGGDGFEAAVQVQKPSLLLPIPVFDSVTAIAAGFYFSAALREDGTVWTWGDQEFGQPGLGEVSNAPVTRPTQVKDPSGQGFLTHIETIWAGRELMLARDSSGQLFMWGSNEYGQFTTSYLDSTVYSLPKPVQFTHPIAEFASGDGACALLNPGGELFTWGENYQGNLGHGNYNLISEELRPVVSVDGLNTLQQVQQIAAADRTMYALLPNGSVLRWGVLGANESSPGTFRSKSRPTPVLGTSGSGQITGMVEIAAGESYLLMRDQNGTVYGLGNTTNQVMGVMPFSANLTPTVISYFGGSPLTNVRAIEPSERHSMYLMADSTIQYTGFFRSPIRNYPYTVRDSSGQDTLRGIVDVAASSDLMLALDADSLVWGWGRNFNGEVGDGTTTDRPNPVRVRDSAGTGFLSGIIDIEARNGVVMALDKNGQVWTWGNNEHGQAGVGDTTSTLLPRLVLDSSGMAPLQNIVGIFPEEDFCMALAADSTVWAWGLNGAYNLADGTDSTRYLPVHVRDAQGFLLRHVVDIDLGELVSAFLLADGSLQTIGFNLDGQTGTLPTLGIATPTQAQAPCRVLEPIAAFAASQTSACESLCVQFTDSSANTVSQWQWEFPGGTPATSSDQHPTVCYDSPGSYQVRLTVSNLGVTDTLVKTSFIEVYPPATADAGADSTVCFGDSVSLTASGGVSFSWSPVAILDCDTCASPTFVAATDQTFFLDVVDANGCLGSDTVSIMVNPLPTADFGVSIDSATFTISLNNMSMEAESFLWDFGDGTQDSSQNPVHAFASHGTYDICLIATNACSSDTLCETITLDPLTHVVASSRYMELRLYPNPTPGELTVTYPDNFEGEELQILDPMGKVVHRLPLEKGNKSSFVLPAAMPNGWYLCQLVAGRRVAGRKAFWLQR